MNKFIFVSLFITCVLAQKNVINHKRGGNVTKYVYDTAKIIAGYGYPVEEYFVSTDDGYILQIQRIPCVKSKTPNSVLLFADFWASSINWVLSGPKYGLAFYLADLGYDVWLGNNRGGKYGQYHKYLKNTDSAFWHYSIHEWGIYDLPAIIDFIIEKNSCNKLSYIGWGFGVNQFFVLASEKPEYMAKIKNMQAFAPNINNRNTASQARIATSIMDEETFYQLAGRYSIIPSLKLLTFLGRDRCLRQSSKKINCEYIEPIVHEGFDIDLPGYPEITNEPPIQGSIRFALHSVQSMSNGFRQYDHGSASNLYFYGKTCPPKYNIKAADIPIALYYSVYDSISVAKDVRRLAIEIPKLIRAFHIKYKKFGYIDYSLSNVGPKVFFKWVAEVLKRYNK